MHSGFPHIYPVYKSVQVTHSNKPQSLDKHTRKNLHDIKVCFNTPITNCNLDFCRPWNMHSITTTVLCLKKRAQIESMCSTLHQSLKKKKRKKEHPHRTPVSQNAYGKRKALLFAMLRRGHRFLCLCEGKTALPACLLGFSPHWSCLLR